MENRELESLAERKLFFHQLSVPDETKRAVKKHWKNFSSWCSQRSKKAFPCDSSDLEAFLIHLYDSGLRNSTIEQAKWAIDWLHKQKNLKPPSESVSLQRTLLGIRKLNKRKLKKRNAVRLEDIERIRFSNDLRGSRDKLVILLGFVGGLRRSELANLKIKDIEMNERGLSLSLLESKTNQTGNEEIIGIPRGKNHDLCPAAAFQEWLNISGIQSGYLIRSIKRNNELREKISEVSIGQIVKKYVEQIGLDAANYCGHSLRAGCVTHLLSRQIPINVVAKHLRHKKVETTIGYDRNQTLDQIKNAF